jgi:hypothetical protein
MQARAAAMWFPDLRHLRRAGERIVQLYQAWGKPAQAAEWKAKVQEATPSPSSGPR